LKFDWDKLILGHIMNRLDAIDAKLDMILRGGVSDEQYRILMADLPVREKAKKLGRSIGWISKWMKHLGNINTVHRS